MAMPYKKYVEGKYSCNHPESDFVTNSEGPIEMKKDNFVEYTHRNESTNLQYDVWGNSDSTARLYKDAEKYSPKSSTNKKANGSLSAVIILILIYGIPVLLGILAEIFD